MPIGLVRLVVAGANEEGRGKDMWILPCEGGGTTV